jgi:MFS transporter, DHA2 family, multidrug resistance protein
LQFDTHDRSDQGAQGAFQADPSAAREDGDPVASRQLALQRLSDLREEQAGSLAYFDIFWLAAILGLALVPLVLLMKRSVAEKGEPIGGE